MLSPKLILIIEGKNHSGNLQIQRDQMIQEYLDTREVLENPISQAHRHKILLRYWLNQYRFPPIRIEYLVVVSKTQTEVKICPDYPEARQVICKADDLLRKIEEIESIKNVPYKQCLDRISTLLLKDQYTIKKRYSSNV